MDYLVNLESELKKPSLLIRNRIFLKPKFIPKELLFREEEQRKLIEFFKPVIKNPREYSQSILVCGNVGTGKTSIVQKFGQMVHEYSRRKSLNLEYVHVNCRKTKSAPLTVHEIVKKFIPGYPTRGFRHEEILSCLKEYLNRKGIHVIIALDEVDALLTEEHKKKKSLNLLYALTRLTDEDFAMEERISIILIAQNDSFKSLLDDCTLSTIKNNVIFLKPYTEQQLREIVSQRVALAFYENAVTNEAIKLVVDVTVSGKGKGDVRYAFELLERAGMYAQNQNALKVQPEHIRYANQITDGFADKIQFLDEQEKKFLLFIARELQKTQRAYFSEEKMKKLFEALFQDGTNYPNSLSKLLSMQIMRCHKGRVVLSDIMASDLEELLLHGGD